MSKNLTRTETDIKNDIKKLENQLMKLRKELYYVLTKNNKISKNNKRSNNSYKAKRRSTMLYVSGKNRIIT